MPRTANRIELPVLAPLDRGAGRLGLQLAQQLRDAIRGGALRPGDPLPATRHLASALKVARGTVVEAFELLVAEGWLASKAGAGTSVARPPAADPAPATSAGAAGFVRPLPAAAARYAAVAAALYPLPAAPFAISVPTGRVAPDDSWRKLSNRVRASRAAAPAGYADPQGLRPLRAAIADYARKARSVACEADQVVITAGTQQGLHLASAVLLGENDQAWVEDPAYVGLTALLEGGGRASRIVRVPVDAEGLCVEEGVRRAPHARVAFVTPSHQYPLGMPMSMARREALLAWARARNAWIVEDDYDSELRYAGHPYPALQGMGGRQVIYLGTFSKILFPSLRIGYLIAPPDLVAAFRGARITMDRHPPTADQHVLAAFIAEGLLDRHVRRIRKAYSDSRLALIDLLRAHLPAELAQVQPIDQGVHLLVWLHAAIDDVALARRAADAGVAVRPLSVTYGEQGGLRRSGLILGFGGYPVDRMALAAQRLARLIRDAARPPH